jgi:phage antirepressor YoqD-like protein
MTFSDRVRDKLRAYVGWDGQVTVKVAAKAIGVHENTLFRFLKGENVSSVVLDAIIAYLEKEGMDAW